MSEKTIFLTTAQVAKKAAVSKATVHSYAHQGLLRHYPRRRKFVHWRFYPEVVSIIKAMKTPNKKGRKSTIPISEVIYYRRRGETLQAIAERFNVSHQNIEQCINRHMATQEPIIFYGDWEDEA